VTAGNPLTEAQRMINSKYPLLKVLVVDDTVLYRKIVCDALAEIPNVQVVGTAHNGKSAMQKVRTERPDLLTLDIEMPEMNGLQVLQALRTEAPEVGTIMLSTLTHEGGSMTMRALELGAFDFVPKPQSGTMSENRLAIKNALTPMLAAYARRRALKNTRGRLTASGLLPKVHPLSRSAPNPVSPGILARQRTSAIIAIGVSTGGPMALARVLPMLPADIGVPIVIVQHMPPIFTQSLAKSLDGKSAIAVKEAVDGEPLITNVAYIAPGGKQMKIVASYDGRQRMLKITEDPPENNCRPSVDYLFRSVADHYVGRATGVIMTGMGADGNTGLKRMKQNGAIVIAQDEATCVVFGMPKEPIESGTADVVAPLDRIAEEMLKTVRPRGKEMRSVG
jgi:two-component system chemotaxis response regulator CheB